MGLALLSTLHRGWPLVAPARAATACASSPLQHDVELTCDAQGWRRAEPLPTPPPCAPQVGTFAIAYAAHKALSPVRFPPTVALTPLVAQWIGKKPAEGSSDSS